VLAPFVLVKELDLAVGLQLHGEACRGGEMPLPQGEAGGAFLQSSLLAQTGTVLFFQRGGIVDFL
jgi:hypothetical protein